MSMRKDLGSRLPDLAERLRSESGRRYWRTLDELAGNEAFQELMRGEFPSQADVWPSSMNRRHFLTLMGASLALAGLGGCSVKPAPERKIVPYVRPPRSIVPGEPLFFATTMTSAGSAVGLLVESHMGRPTKVEGNPDHPASLGATSIFHQASILTLYDPDRSQTVTHLGRPRTWTEGQAAIRSALERARRTRGAGVRFLSEPILSPSLADRRRAVLESLPDARWHTYAPAGRDAHYEGTSLAFGARLNSHYDLSRADVVLALDADFLSCGPTSLRDVAQFMSRRRVRTSAHDAAQAEMNRLYVVETAVTGTGAKADHRLALPTGQIESLARAIAARLGIDAAARGETADDRWVNAVAADLERHRGRSLILAGDRQPAVVHLLAHALNNRLENVGRTIFYTEPIEGAGTDNVESLRALVGDMAQNRVELLFVMGGNPAYSAPADFEFAHALDRVPLRVHLGLYQDETARRCHWHIPEAHYLEAWGDARTFDGTASLVQPLIEPLYGGRSAIEVAGFCATLEDTPGEQIVRRYWRGHWRPSRPGERFFEFWKTSLHDGLIRDTAFAAQSVRLRADWQAPLRTGGTTLPAEETGDRLELTFQLDPTIGDGTFANNGWLQELPKPITRLTWDNAAVMSPNTARRLGLAPGAPAHGGDHGGNWMPVVELRLGDRTVKAPVWIMPGHAEHSISVSLGYGRDAAGRVGGQADRPVGFNAYALRTSAGRWFAPGLSVTKSGETRLLACTQTHQLMEGRDIVRATTLGAYRQDPQMASHPSENADAHRKDDGAQATLYQPFNYDAPTRKWGMVIDLTSCIGCGACVVACQAENNIPVVGKEQVAAGREMHWLRIDRYIAGPMDKPEEFHFQPVPCMHCEQAPCEYVCPVAATVHSAEGLNDMIYNRCIGTRFCSNNCPYKVRRFNFLHYADFATPSLRLQYNPDVTVRSRGVMEKCTYCVQRIRHAEIAAEREGRPIADGEVVAACQAACPATAIAFGDLNDARSTVAQWRDAPLNYGLLADLNTRPRTTYLAALRNPNPELEGA